MPAAKSWVVGYRAHNSKNMDLLAIGRLMIPAMTADAAMGIAMKRVPQHIQHPGCHVRIRFVKEQK